MSRQCGGEDEKEADPDEEGSKVSLVSVKEERDLQTLLDKFTIEVHDLADFQQRLQHELTSLEVKPACPSHSTGTVSRPGGLRISKILLDC